MTKPKFKKVEYKNLNPEAGLAALLVVNPAPEGYEFVSMERKGSKATVTYRKKEKKGR